MTISQLQEVLFKLTEMRQDTTGKEREAINAKMNQVRDMIAKLQRGTK